MTTTPHVCALHTRHPCGVALRTIMAGAPQAASTAMRVTWPPHVRVARGVPLSLPRHDLVLPSSPQPPAGCATGGGPLRAPQRWAHGSARCLPPGALAHRTLLHPARRVQAAWRRRHGMAVRSYYPSAAAKQAAYRTRKQAAQALAAQECAAIQQALGTRALADQSWELYELIDACSRDPDMPRQVPASRPVDLLAGGSSHFYGMATARVRRHRRALQRLAQVRATKEAQAGVPRDADRAAACKPATRTGGASRAARVTGLVLGRGQTGASRGPPLSARSAGGSLQRSAHTARPSPARGTPRSG